MACGGGSSREELRKHGLHTRGYFYPYGTRAHSRKAFDGKLMLLVLWKNFLSLVQSVGRFLSTRNLAGRNRPTDFLFCDSYLRVLEKTGNSLFAHSRPSSDGLRGKDRFAPRKNAETMPKRSLNPQRSYFPFSPSKNFFTASCRCAWNLYFLCESLSTHRYASCSRESLIAPPEYFAENIITTRPWSYFPKFVFSFEQ